MIGNGRPYKKLLLAGLPFSFFRVALLTGPVLYPNDHLKTVGEERSKLDVQECERQLAEYVKSNGCCRHGEKHGRRRCCWSRCRRGDRSCDRRSRKRSRGRGSGGGATGLLSGLFRIQTQSGAYELRRPLLRERGYDGSVRN